MLSHNPDVFPVAAKKGFALTIAGHTHGGQVNVEILHQGVNVARFFTPYVDGLYTEGTFVDLRHPWHRHRWIAGPSRRTSRDRSHTLVRYLILSDMHANLEALTAVLKTPPDVRSHV